MRFCSGRNEASAAALRVRRGDVATDSPSKAVWSSGCDLSTNIFAEVSARASLAWIDAKSVE